MAKIVVLTVEEEAIVEPLRAMGHDVHFFRYEKHFKAAAPSLTDADIVYTEVALRDTEYCRIGDHIENIRCLDISEEKPFAEMTFVVLARYEMAEPLPASWGFPTIAVQTSGGRDGLQQKLVELVRRAFPQRDKASDSRLKGVRKKKTAEPKR